MENKNPSEEEILTLFKNNPEFLKEIERLVDPAPTSDPRVVHSTKTPYLVKSLTICPLCEEIKTEEVLMEYVPRLSSYVRVRHIKPEESREELDKLRKDTRVHVSIVESCNQCPIVLEMLSKNDLISKLLETKQEKENRLSSLRRDLLELENEN